MDIGIVPALLMPSTWQRGHGCSISVERFVDITEADHMARTVIDLDEAAWRAAAEELGTTTKVDTVNKALRLVRGRGERLAFLEHLAADLGDDEVMRGAWRL